MALNRVTAELVKNSRRRDPTPCDWVGTPKGGSDMQPELGTLRGWAQNPTFKIKAYVDIYVITELMKITRLTHKEQENQSIHIKAFFT